MENNRTMIGIIDIGSNSIRLAIYETTSQGEYRLVNENKESARLSEKITSDGVLEKRDILSIVPILVQFRDICRVYGCQKIRVAATAAIRNASNADQIVELLTEKTDLQVELLSGEQEAYFGFVGVVGGMEMDDGFIIDIGGGSTEITLFRDRKLLRSISLPLGAVNAQLKFGDKDSWTTSEVEGLKSEIERMLAGVRWVTAHPELPLIGLGGTIRTLGKLNQRKQKYPLRVAHHYKLERESIESFADTLPYMPLEKRKRIDGLSKTRSDIIVPGTIILQMVFSHIGASHCLVSGTGIREGLLLDMLGIGVPSPSEVLPRQTRSLLAFHNVAPMAHFEQVSHFAKQLYDLMVDETEEPGTRKLITTAAMLYKIGSGIRYHQYDKHTMYWLMNAPLGALNHREVVLCGSIVDYVTNHGKRMGTSEYRSLLQERDTELISKLGTLLELAIALDISETQCIQSMNAKHEHGALLLKLKCRSQAYLETRQLEAAAKNFKKIWGIKLEWEIQNASTH
ncbi:Ppx/GppA family phosphatase [Paenibacillus puldeungensis]|uniref:Ppx/GppA family phosphatase n=1 Tax=Paenibacillus puldeungensis TaxID=696536 RepID=A0ABW3RWY9_9BACL